MLKIILSKFLLDAAVILILILGIWLFRSPQRARQGNFAAIGALSGALLLVLWRHDILTPEIVAITMFAGGLIGYLVAMRVTMIHMPAMVAFQHGAGGIAAFLISYVELTRLTVSLTPFSKLSGFLGLTIGAATFSASMLAAGKLGNKIKPAPVRLPGHSLLLLILIGVIVLLGVMAWQIASPHIYCFLMIVLAVIMGIIFAMRIGGADMPVLISFLNATAGFAAAFCGSVINNRLLVVCGATVAASGSVLTIVMCRAMNRGLWNIFIDTQKITRQTSAHITPQAVEHDQCPAPAEPEAQIDPCILAIDVMRKAANVIIIPGYGMAMAQAQAEVAALAQRLEGLGKQVRFAIHPVAGRMPGHMNVLLAEVDISYDKLIEMEIINPEFKDTDLVLVVGASDVVNPAATEREGTPISGMPILKANEARSVIVCNLDDKPGYSGVPNTLYSIHKTILLFGDAKQRLQELMQGLT